MKDHLSHCHHMTRYGKYTKARQQVAQLWQRDRASSIDDFKRWVNLQHTCSWRAIRFALLRHYAYLLNVYVSDQTFSAI